jgi:uncharacterized membrane protein YjfL (UPF0719 family)
MAAPAHVPAAPASEALEATRGLLRGARLLALVLIASSVWRAAAGAGERRVPVLVGFGAAALALWGATTFLQHRLLFGRHLHRQLVRGNLAAAVAAGADQVALALITSRAIAGDSLAELPAALAFGLLAQITWAVFVALFRAVTAYRDDQEIAAENHAAAISYAGAALALGAIIARAVDGPFLGWKQSLGAYGAALLLAAALYPIRQLIVEGLLLGCRPRWRGGELDRAIGQHRSVGVAAVEAAAYLAMALLALGHGG